MKNGRFLHFGIFNSLIHSAFPRFIVEDEGGGGEVDRFGEEVPPDEGKTAEAAPDAEKVAELEKGKVDEGTEKPAPSEEKAPVVADEDLLNELNPEESPEAKLKRIDRDYAASSKESQRLSAKDKAVAKFFEEQGIDIKITKDAKGNITGVNTLANDKYSADAAKLNVKISDLPVDQKEALESGDLDQIQTVIEKIEAKYKSALVRAQPTLDKEPPHLSEERKASVFERMETAKDVFDKPKHENFAENKKQIEAFINHPARSQALRDLFATDPEAAAELVNSHINSVKARLIGRATAAKVASDKKEKEAQGKTAASVDSEGNTSEAGKSSGYTFDRLNP